MTEVEHTVLVSASDESRALAVLVLDHAVCAAERRPGGIRVTLRPGQDPAAAARAVAQRLVEAGVDVCVADPTVKGARP